MTHKPFWLAYLIDNGEKTKRFETKFKGNNIIEETLIVTKKTTLRLKLIKKMC